ncbi:hypothetical protein D9M68_665340 [compost metagenome]
MTWIITSNGRQVDLINPRAELVSTVDIAHSLAMICRFNGHCYRHYSVAQHSLLVSSIVPAEHKLVALLHDAPEAYVGDLTRPLKEELREASRALGVEPIYQAIEQRIWLAICERFDIDPAIPDCVKEADMIALATERRDLLPDHPAAWDCLKGIQALPQPIEQWSPEHARQEFHNELMNLLRTTHRASAA